MWTLIKKGLLKLFFGGRTGISSKELIEELDRLDSLSNQVDDLLTERRYDEALDVCRQLLEDYPSQVDGLDRLAETYAAMGRYDEAANYYRKAAKFMSDQEYFEQAAVDHFLSEAEKLEKQVR